MSSEIEVVEEVQQPSGYGGSGENQVGSDSLKNDVYTAVAYGDMEKMRRLMETEGASVAEPDGLGYYALQWAALNNNSATAQYIIEHGGDVNAADHTGQTALHWSAVRGAIQVTELLLREGARVNAADIYGYQFANGMLNLMFLTMMDEPLYTDCTRLLLYVDAYWTRQDKEDKLTSSLPDYYF